MNAKQATEIWVRGRSSWPALVVSEAQMIAFLPLDPAAPMPSLAYAEDLYLACACALGEKTALETFETRYRTDVDRALKRMGLSPELRDEVRQAVRTKLFLTKTGRVSQIHKYSGRGRLGGWLRAVVVRTAIDILRKEKSDEIPVDHAILETLAEADVDPDIRTYKRDHRELANQAFEEGFAKLSTRDRHLLRQHYLHHVNIDQLGTMYNVHRATVFRWIARARASVFSDAREAIARSLGQSKTDAGDLLRILESQIDVSIERLLRTTNEPEAE